MAEKDARVQMEQARNLGLLAKELGISVRTLYRGKDIQLGQAENDQGVPREKKLEDEIHRLKQSLANRALELGFFKGALQRVKARRQPNIDWRRGTYDQIRDVMPPIPTISFRLSRLRRSPPLFPFTLTGATGFGAPGSPLHPILSGAAGK